VSLLEVKDLRTQINLRNATVRAVDGVSFSVEPGETLGLVGESGCGKTMTGMSIMRLLPPGGHIAGGHILFGDYDLATADMATMRKIRGNEIGMVFQDPMTSLNPTMNIGNQIAESVRLHRGVSKAEALDRAKEVMSLVGMPRPAERLEDYPHQLSGGLRQRVMIAMALACEPKLLVADEPTTALDVTIQAQILTLLDELKAKLGMAMILITHDMGVIAGRADRVMVMYAGQIVESAETVELFERMRHPYTEALLASIPQLDQDITQRLYSIPGIPPDLTHPPTGCRFAARCRYATDKCRAEDPKLGGPDAAHPFACFYPREISVEELVDAGPATAVAAEAPEGAVPVGQVAELGADAFEVAPVFVAGPSGEVASLLSSSGSTRTGEVVLELVHVVKEFTVTAGAVLQRKVGTVKATSDVSFKVNRGETFGLVGESGCGKTTIGRMIVALEKPTSGQILFEGRDIFSLDSSELRVERRHLQLMFQDPYASLDPRMRVGSIIREPLTIQKMGDKRAQGKRVAELLAEVGLNPQSVNRYPHEFSGGQRQRIGLARALALNPKVIVADEPVSALDVSIRSQILNLMKSLQATHGLTYVLISHDLSVVRYLADRIGVMYLGKLVEVGTGQDIYERAAHPYTAGLLKTIPVPNPTVERNKRGVAVKGELPSPLNPPSGCRFRTRCPLAQDICAEVEPPMTTFGGEHEAACHFPLQTPVTLQAQPLAAGGVVPT
jgi:peptide/nickel transport system ATP-binding protein